jgi:photosystem II stability/assembly factor-like uncharacterized protein
MFGINLLFFIYEGFMKIQYYLLVVILFALTSTLNSQEWKACGKDSKGAIGVYPSVLVSLDNDLYTGTLSGLFKSTDLGDSWNLIENGLPATFTKGLVRKGNNLFVLTYGSGVYKLQDNSGSWVDVSVAFKPTFAEFMLVDGNNLFAGSYVSGLFVSTDDGSTWSEFTANLQYKDMTCMFILGNSIYVGTGAEGVFVTNDNGVSWQQINNGLTNLWITSLVAIGDNLYAGTINQTTGGVFFSQNKGQNWTKINSDLLNYPIYSLVNIDNVLFAGNKTGKVAYSKDNGTNWIATSDNLPSGTVLKISDYGDYIFTSIRNGGVYKIEKSVSVLDKLTNNNFEISPNPAGDFITIALGAINPMLQHRVVSDSQICIYNTLGEKMLSAGNSSDLPIRINISDLPKGMYFVKAGSETAKFVKM